MSSIIEVSLSEMLERREQRAARQAELLKHFHCPLVSFSMNIPGPVKTNSKIRAAFEQGKTALLEAVSRQTFSINFLEEIHEATGDELLLSADAPARELKALTTRIEDEHPLGRLFDLDVIGADGEKLSRFTFRRCLVCGRQAQACARARAHPVAELQAAVERLLSEAGIGPLI
ncbi:MAG: citrate lyase holo-[acyl-carrier protein] synthase [Fretibacterium sp.]|nr:citrate lyase holo-[acyl-carrier protein] synthase [Fretibacterium sp.]